MTYDPSTLIRVLIIVAFIHYFGVAVFFTIIAADTTVFFALRWWDKHIKNLQRGRTR